MNRFKRTATIGLVAGILGVAAAAGVGARANSAPAESTVGSRTAEAAHEEALGISEEQHEAGQPELVGSASVGTPNAGRLVNAVQLPRDPKWRVVLDPERSWGTQETVDSIGHAISRVHEEFPDTRSLMIGDISYEHGGRFSPHSSHQSGRDIDIGFYYRTKAPWYTVGKKDNLDLPRTWELLRVLAAETNVEVIFLDWKIQNMLRRYAVSVGEDRAFLNRVFDGKGIDGGALVQHKPRHDTHIHVRFVNPIAQANGLLAADS